MDLAHGSNIHIAYVECLYWWKCYNDNGIIFIKWVVISFEVNKEGTFQWLMVKIESPFPNWLKLKPFWPSNPKDNKL